MEVAHLLLNISYQKWCLYQMWEYVCVLRILKIDSQQISFMQYSIINYSYLIYEFRS